MAEFHVLVYHALTEQDRAALRPLKCTIVAEFGPANAAPSVEPPIPPEAWRTLEGSTGYVVRVPAGDQTEAVDRVGAAGIDDATIWRDFPAAALP